MTFDELFDKACASAHLPEMARIQLPNSISEKTKRKMLKLTPEKLGGLLTNAIDEVNHGSIEPIDALISKEIEDRKIGNVRKVF